MNLNFGNKNSLMKKMTYQKIHWTHYQNVPKIYYYYILLKLLAILPVSTALVERSFSSLKRIKTYLRNSTGEARLNGLALLNIHRDKQIDKDIIINMFASIKRKAFRFKIVTIYKTNNNNNNNKNK
jgi:hypothetical protein